MIATLALLGFLAGVMSVGTLVWILVRCEARVWEVDGE